MLNDDTPGTTTVSPSVATATTLTRGLSQTTTNVIYSLFGINHRPPISLPSTRRTNEHLPSGSPRPNSRLQNSDYQLNDLLTSYYAQNSSIQNPQQEAQLDSVIDLITQQQQLEQPAQNNWTGLDAWDGPSFDFDDPSIDF